jgi:NitT/TauT family transport system substrate-binding protein
VGKKLSRVGMTIFLIICIVTMFGCSTSREARKTAELAKAEAAIEELRVGMAGLDIKTACIIIAQQLGYFDEEGVSVKFETISNLADGLTAVEQGKLDILPFGVIPSCTFIAQGSDLYVFGGTISEGSEIIVTAENATRIKSAEDFIGKKIGCFRMETGHMVVKGYLREAGIDIGKDVEFIYLDSQNSIVEAVKKGEVDLGFVNSGFGCIAQKSGLAVAATAGDFVADFPCCRQTTSHATLTNKRAALVKFQTAALRAYETYLTDKDTAIAALVDYCGQDAEYVEAIMYGLDGKYENAMIISLDPNKKKVVEFYQVMKANGDISADTEYNMEEQIDVSIYEDALKSMLSRYPDSKIYTQLLDEFERNNL